METGPFAFSQVDIAGFCAFGGRDTTGAARRVAKYCIDQVALGLDEVYRPCLGVVAMQWPIQCTFGARDNPPSMGV